MHDDKFTKGMRGEFKGDFTRDTFDPLRHFSRVLMQQGRVQLDADKNESDSIHLHHLRSLASDLIGPHGAPTTINGEEGNGFKISANADGSDFNIATGHYYVNGILCENDKKDTSYLNQPDLPLTKEESETPLPENGYLVYLDVWERHLSYVEDDYIREKALGGVDTASRAQIVWQVKVLSRERFKEAGFDLDAPSRLKTSYNFFLNALQSINEKKPGTGQLRARARKASDDNKNPCLTSPEASYRGAENQLYRVEIHNNNINENKPTIKWSRENASVIFPVTGINGNIITLENLGRDCRFGLKPNDWVEIIDDDYTLRNRADVLLQIEDIDAENLQITLKNESGLSFQFDKSKHPYLRRWDQSGENLESGIPFSTGTDWILLEDGIEVQFPAAKIDNEKDNKSENYRYHTGDYWLIPARTATGDVEWPGTPDEPLALPSQGVEHHYAPLAAMSNERDTDKRSIKKKASKRKEKEVAVEVREEDDNLDLRRKLIKPWS